MKRTLLHTRLLLMIIAFLLIPGSVSAHVKWFKEVEPERLPIEQVLTPFFMGTALVLALLLGLITQLEPYFSKSSRLVAMEKRIERGRRWTFVILQYGLAIALLLQLLSGTVFAPEISLTEHEFAGATYVAIAVIILLLTGSHIAAKLAIVGLLALFVKAVAAMGVFHMLDYGFYLAIMAALVLYRTRWQPFAMPLLYLGTGLSLCWVAAEKWIYPNMSTDIIERFAIPTFGFSAATFIVLAAFVEFVVGYLLVVGILNRFLSIIVTLLFITTTTVFGATEIIGHFMIHTVLIIFIIEGVSFYRPPVQMHKRPIDQVVFVTLNFLFVLAVVVLLYYRFAG